MKGDYSGQVTSIPAGAYTISNGSGGADVGAFTKNLTLASAMQWTNQTAVSSTPIERAKPLTLTWTGGDPSTYAFIEGNLVWRHINDELRSDIHLCRADRSWAVYDSLQ